MEVPKLRDAKAQAVAPTLTSSVHAEGRTLPRRTPGDPPWGMRDPPSKLRMFRKTSTSRATVRPFTMTSRMTEERSLAAIMFTDIVGYSAMAAQDEARSLRLLDEHRELLRPLFSAHEGREIKTLGDGFFVAFPDAPQAVKCALEIQQTLRERNQRVPAPERVQLRIGIHVDHVVLRDGDVYGNGVNIAARVEPLARPGGICVTEEVIQKLPGDFLAQHQSLGRLSLKNLGARVGIYRVLAPGQRALPSFLERARLHLGPWRVSAAVALLLVVLALMGTGMGSSLPGRLMPWRSRLISSQAAHPTAQPQGAPTPTTSASPLGFRPVTVAVADFANEAGEPDLDGLAGMLTTSLEQSRGLHVLTRTRMFDLLRTLGHPEVKRIDERLGQEMARAAGVKALLVPTVRRFGALYTIDVRALDPANGESLFSLREEGHRKDNLPRLLDRLSERVHRALVESPADAPALLPLAQVTTYNLEAYALYYEGERLLNQLDIQGAQARYRKAIALDPDFALAHWRLGYADDWLGVEDSPALAQAERLAERLPEKERLLLRAQRATHESHAHALELLRVFIARYPEEKEALFMAGDHTFHWGDSEEAIPLFERALALDPAMGRAHQHLIRALQATGRFAQMRDAAQSYVTHVGNDEAYLFLGAAYLALGEPLRARETYRSTLAVRPGSARVALALGLLELRTDEKEQAEQRLEAMAEAPVPASESLLALESLSLLRAHQGRYADAQRVLQKARRRMERPGTDPETLLMNLQLTDQYEALWSLFGSGDRSRAAAARARLLSRSASISFGSALDLWLGNYDRAEEHSRKGTSGRVTLTFVKALRLRDAGQEEQAIALMEWVAQHQPVWQRFVTWMDLIPLLLKAGHPAKALEATLRLQSSGIDASLSPWGYVLSYPRSFYWKGQALEALGRPGEALASYRRFMELWQKADPDIPEARAAWARIAALEAAMPVQ